MKIPLKEKGTIILIAGSSHTGKTRLAQTLLERLSFPYLSIDHLKMGLIRSGCCPLSVESGDSELTAYLWPVVKEIIKTNLENRQNLIVEGCYIPFDYKKDFSPAECGRIKFLCLIFSRRYSETCFEDVQKYADIIETRKDSTYTKEMLIRENEENYSLCRLHGCPYLLIEDSYPAEFPLDGLL